MRENCTSGSEGGGVKTLPTPIKTLLRSIFGKPLGLPEPGRGPGLQMRPDLARRQRATPTVKAGPLGREYADQRPG